MKEKIIINADECYQQAEEKANHYFQSLYAQAQKKTYVKVLTEDIHLWKHKHIRHPIFSLFSRGKGKTNTSGYHNYIKWLNYTGKLDSYLNRSISYIFMRDLGKALNSPDTENRIRSIVDSLKTQLTSTTADRKNDGELFSMTALYRLAQKEGVESTFIWLINKLKNVSTNIPTGMNAEHAQRKLIKIIAGVIMQENEEMDEEVTVEDRKQRLDKAIRLGYSYGLTYPFIDDLLDAEILSDEEEKQYAYLIRSTLTTGVVPELGDWVGNNAELIRYIHTELREAFEYIKAHQRPETRNSFFEQSYVFFNSQEVDRDKDLTNAKYTNEELYIPVILKSASSRLIVRSVIGAPEDEGFDSRTFFYGIYNQLADDFADMFDDLKDGAVTPYTYYLKYHDTRPDLINPFEMYWTVISNLIHQVYHSDKMTREVILDRAINGLKRFKERAGTEKYKEVMDLFASESPKFNKLIQEMVRKADDVDFFDKLLRDHMITSLKSDRQGQEDFIETAKAIRSQLNSVLDIPKTNEMADSIIDAANYSLQGEGKRLRPIVTWFMGVNAYGLNSSILEPLLKSLEYMHTASLIFDDLPSQDNAALRRGRPTLHEVYTISIAELTGLFLTQKAILEQTTLDQFDSKAVLRLIQYSAQVTADMCRGQAMDLDSKGQQLSLEQLNRMCFYKTGLGFEASILMPAILANTSKLEIDALKKFARHAGIAFQIKDDLLDVEGDTALLGKSTGKDTENNSSTFVSILGVNDAKKEMWENYCIAMESLHDVPRDTAFLKHFLDYVINRDK
ncbi:polyprenyl synthetase family protein [Psychrobacillus psychrodurans]|uniref:polyprenyl synthetase family protein n=1 Tax=Psychrobacillus psychrodurans TaxID=126157 RepID=UPI0008E4ED11|nr:polyprenyl synthetase family protein [Psychrobacillus psychrodurans]MCZ8540494.1 polyprenyl synthetase family protein [Psychrobacillus psychrodurans]SFM69099.1 Geranylgeranyl pyrophosphate synthase [Psychrobacillus psychrodurans]